MRSAEETRNGNFLRDVRFLLMLFRRFDGNGDGKLCRKEKNLLMKKLGMKLTKEEVDCLMDCTDKDRDGCLKPTEFVNMYMFLKENGFHDVDVREAFDLFDTNGDGLIYPSDIQKLLLDLGLNGKRPDLQKNANQVDFEEFKKMVRDW